MPATGSSSSNSRGDGASPTATCSMPFEAVRQTAGKVVLASGQAGEGDDLVRPFGQRVVVPTRPRVVEQTRPEAGARVDVQTGRILRNTVKVGNNCDVLEGPHQPRRTRRCDRLRR